MKIVNHINFKGDEAGSFVHADDISLGEDKSYPAGDIKVKDDPL